MMRGLTADRLREQLDYDPETGIFKWKISKRCVAIGDIAGTDTERGYRLICIDGKRHYEHRLAWLHYYGNAPVDQIDHINRDKKDNRICNLREASPAQNQMNGGVKSHNISGIRGVRLRKNRPGYYARITFEGKQRHLGVFSTAEEAESAYKEAAKKYFGEYANA